MRAVQVVTLDGPAAMQVREVPDPVPGPDQVLIEVHAAGVAYPDVLVSRGLYQYKPEPPFVPGGEVAGIVRSAPESAAVRPGDRVAALASFAAFAELAVVRADAVFPLPDRVSFESGAALPMNYLTMQFALSRRGRLASGETVLVHGAAGGVGTATIQLAKALGATVIAVASSEVKRGVAAKAGADHVIDVTGFKDAVKELTGGRGVDIVADPVGGDRVTDSLRSLAPEGRLLVLGFVGGDIPQIKVNRLLLNNLDVVGVGWGAFAMPRPGFLLDQWDALLPHLRSGAIDPPLGAQFPLEQAGEAVAELEDRRALGKVVLRLRST
jgi:NADPH2:quinone reductase